MATTDKLLQELVDKLGKVTGIKTAPKFTKTKKLMYNYLFLDRAYGGIRLSIRYKTTAIGEISPRLSKGELELYLRAMLRGFDLKKFKN